MKTKVLFGLLISMLLIPSVSFAQIDDIYFSTSDAEEEYKKEEEQKAKRKALREKKAAEEAAPVAGCCGDCADKSAGCCTAAGCAECADSTTCTVAE